MRPISAADGGEERGQQRQRQGGAPELDHRIDRLLRIALLRELRGALGDQRVALADEGPVLDRAGEHDLAPGAERVGDGAGVGDRDARRGVLAVGDPEADRLAVVADRAGHDLAGQVVGLAGGRVEQLRGLLGLGRGAERRVDEGGGEQHRCPERHHQADLPFALGVQGRG